MHRNQWTFWSNSSQKSFWLDSLLLCVHWCDTAVSETQSNLTRQAPHPVANLLFIVFWFYALLHFFLLLSLVLLSQGDSTFLRVCWAFSARLILSSKKLCCCWSLCFNLRHHCCRRLQGYTGGRGGEKYRRSERERWLVKNEWGDDQHRGGESHHQVMSSHPPEPQTDQNCTKLQYHVVAENMVNIHRFIKSSTFHFLKHNVPWCCFWCEFCWQSLWCWWCRHCCCCCCRWQWHSYVVVIICPSVITASHVSVNLLLCPHLFSLISWIIV